MVGNIYGKVRFQVWNEKQRTGWCKRWKWNIADVLLKGVNEEKVKQVVWHNFLGRGKRTGARNKFWGSCIQCNECIS